MRSQRFSPRDNTNRTLDAMAVNCWKSRGYVIHGYEIKVTRKDFLRELQDPGKHETFYTWVDKFILVTPHKLIRPDELPARWGLMELDANGRWLRMTKRPTNLGRSEVDTVERDRIVCFARAMRRVEEK